MKEQKILSAATNNREHWTTLSKYLDTSSLSPLGKRVFKELSEYYESDTSATGADLELIREALLESDPKGQTEIIEYLAGLPENPSDMNVVKAVVEQHKQAISRQIAIAAGMGDLDEVDRLVHRYSETQIDESEDKPQVYTAPSIADMAHKYDSENLLPLYPSRLNDLLGGGVARQTQIGIVARPDVGKSTVAMNIAVPMCERGYKVIYFGNEDPDQTMILRAYTRFLRRSREEVLENPTIAYHEAIEKGLDNFTFIRLQPGTLEEVLRYVDELQPDCIIIDQLRNMTTNIKNGGLTDNLNNLAAATRAIAKQYDLVSILITQAGESAHGKLVLDYTDVEYSNTGFAAALDLMIGVGQNAEFKSQGRVMLAFPKNKLSEPITPFEAVIDYKTNRVMT